ncbi:F-box protein [Camellia lanceoleosa]|uniref:F-box protein n=1 Tax=Camellia lanceoleosa TaxID=1840588 RepID=A0ACC0H1K2_9ERIC|nr:F-box protein [Camellia lanceoleosa]
MRRKKSNYDILFSRGVFWNSLLHWVSRGGLSFRFDVEQDCVCGMPMPSVKKGWVEKRLGYFHESGDNLYLIEMYGLYSGVFDVKNMKRDYSGWFVKYHVNLNAVVAEYPVMVMNNVQEIHHFIFSLMHIIQ